MLLGFTYVLRRLKVFLHDFFLVVAISCIFHIVHLVFECELVGRLVTRYNAVSAARQRDEVRY
jgi:hypothetical protein